MHQSFFRPNSIFNNDAYFLDFSAQKYPLIFFNVNSFSYQHALHFGVPNYEKQHEVGICKVLGRAVIFSAFYADFCLCPKSLIITTLGKVLVVLLLLLSVTVNSVMAKLGRLVYPGLA